MLQTQETLRGIEMRSMTNSQSFFAVIIAFVVNQSKKEHLPQTQKHIKQNQPLTTNLTYGANKHPNDYCRTPASSSSLTSFHLLV